jgi:TonB family protein
LKIVIIMIIMHFSGKDRDIGEGERLARRPPTRAALRIGFALWALQLLALGQQQIAPEDQVKAAYLFNFAKLAEWPQTALPDGPSPLVIGVSGGDQDFLDLLKAVVAEKVIGTHPLLVKSLSSGDDMKSCHIVFFRASERRRSQAAIAGLAQAGVLLVGEDKSFLRQGGMINLVLERGNIRFEVNPDALDRSGIHFSSKILAMAKAGYESSAAAVSNSPAGAARQLAHGVPPEYPAIAERMNLSGTAQVQVLVKADGTVKEVKVLGGHPLLTDALARAVRLWRYQPGPKETVEIVKFSFGPP